jgi:hypothetical protein
MLNLAEIKNAVTLYFETNHKREFLKVSQKWLNKGLNPKGFPKYFQWAHRIEVCSAWYLAAFDRPGLRHLDISGGMGWLCYIARVMGHDTILSDAPDSQQYQEGLEALGLSKTFSFCVEAQKPIPAVGVYDVITSTGICFHQKFTMADWGFLIADLSTHLNRGGNIFLQANYTPGFPGFDSFRKIAAPQFRHLEWIDDNTLLLRGRI